MSGHCAARSHLSRLRIVEEAMCVCMKDYETVNHLIWHFGRFETEKRRLTNALVALDVQLGTQKKWPAMKYCLNFLRSLKIGISNITGQILPRTLDGLGQ
jgi:hypothetical protein